MSAESHWKSALAGKSAASGDLSGKALVSDANTTLVVIILMILILL
jgi:hypothetical protein